MTAEMKIAPAAAVTPAFVLLALVAACADDEAPPVRTPPSGVTAVAPSLEEGPEDATLTPEQKAKVREIIENDPTVRQALGGRAYSIEDMGPWTTGVIPETGAFQLVGGTAKITLAEPAPRVELDWPYQSYRPYYHLWPPEVRARYLPYREGTQRFTVDNLREMYVLVDLDRQKVAEITVLGLGDQVVTYPPVPTPEPVPGGEKLAREIFVSDERVQAILAGRDYGMLGVWTGAYRDTRLAGVIVQWDEREDIETDWRILIDLNEETGAYSVLTVRFKAETVGRLDVLIDLDKQQVITIAPSVGD